MWLAAITASLLAPGGLASAQTLIPGDHHLRLGEPPLLTVKARLPADQAPAGLLPHRCLSASLQPVDPRDGAAIELEWHDAERHADGSTWVTFIHPDPLRLLRMLLRATLHCGPGYTRLQVLQAQPELDDESAEPPIDPTPPARPAAMLPTPRPAPPSPPVPPNRPPKPETPSRPGRPPAPMQAAVPEVAATSAALAWHEPTVTSPSPMSPSPMSPPEPMQSASPLTDAFVQVWQRDLRQLKDELAPLRHQLAAQELRLGAQEDLRRDGLIGLLTVGAGVLAALLFGRSWRETRLRRFHREGAALVVTPPRTEMSGDRDSESGSDWIGMPHPAASTTPVRLPEPATLDEARHQALFDEVDALRGSGNLEAAIALLETAQEGEIERPPGLLLRLIDLYRRLAQTELQVRTMQELSRLYAVDVPAPDACRLIEELDPSGARHALIAALPAWSDASDESAPARHAFCQHLSAALLGDADGLRLGWRDFQTALAWHAELAAERDDQTSTRSMPPELACCT